MFGEYFLVVTLLNSLQIALGQSFTIAISEDMRKVFGCGKADHGVFGQRNISGDHHILFVSIITHYGGTPLNQTLSEVSLFQQLLSIHLGLINVS